MTDPAGNLFMRSKTAAKRYSLPDRYKIIVWSMLLFLWLPSLYAQVSPAEIRNPRLQAAEQSYLPQLVALNQDVSRIKFPFKFSLNRHVGLDPKDQVGADTRGLEFVNFNEREVLKFSGNYNAAFNADSLTPNQRAGRVLNEVILPVLQLLPKHFTDQAAFDAFGFEIGYHVRKHTSSYEFEGKENLVVVLGKSDGLRYAALREDTARQEILNGSEIYLNGEPFGLALNTDTPFDIEALVRRPAVKKISANEGSTRQAANRQTGALSEPKSDGATPGLDISAKTIVDTPPAAGKVDLDLLPQKYQSELESLRKEGMEKYHFVDYAPPSFIVYRNKPALQLTLRNPQTFDKDATSIYKRAAQTFDLFLAAQLNGILAKIPETPDFDALNFTVILNLTSSGSSKSSEAVEFVVPLRLARRFAAADITNQDLINQSVVLVNGVRIALNLAQVE